METFKQGIKPGLWGAVLGAIVLAVIGFNWGGWITSSGAKEMTETAVVDTLVPICVAQFNADPDKAAGLAGLKKADSWKRGDFVVKQGWAVMPGAKEADGSVADRCADRITS